MSTDTTPRTCKTLSPVTLPCPMCGAIEASISINLAELNEDGSGDEFTCRDCEVSFGRAFINAVLARWPAVIRWVESAPQFEESER